MLSVHNSSFSSIPVRTTPQPWEDMASLVSRVAGCMGYKNPQWILHPEENSSTIQPFNLCMLREKKDYLFFEHLLQLDEEMQYSLSLHRFTQHIQVPKSLNLYKSSEVQRPLLSRHTFQTFFRPYSATAVCSACLAEQPAYGRLYWSIFPVVACLRHNIFLTYQCPACFRSIPLLRSSLSHCPRCKSGDYRASPTISLAIHENFQEDQALLLSYLGIENVYRDDYVRSNGNFPLRDILPWQYFQLLDAFRCILSPLFPNAPFLQGKAEARMLLRQHSRPNCTLTLPEWSVLIATFHWLFTAWPDNFFVFLDAFPNIKSSRVRKRDQERTAGVQRDFGVLYEKWLYGRLTDPAFTFLRQAFESYLNKHYTGGEITRRLLPFRDTPMQQRYDERPYMTKIQTLVALGVGEQVLQSLINQGLLRTLKKPLGQTGKRTLYLIEKKSIEVLQREWDGLLPLDVLIKSRLGVTKAIVLSLEQAGILLPRRGPSVDSYKIHLYSQKDIVQFEHALLSRSVSVSVCSTNVLPLPKISNQIGISLIEIINEVLSGRLPLFEVKGNQPLFHRLVLPCDQIPNFLREYKRRQYEEQGLLTISDAAKCIRVSEKVIRRWAQLGLLKSEKLVIGGKQPPLLFRKIDVEVFHRTYVFADEVSERLRVVPHTVRKYVRRGTLHPILGRMAGKGGNQLIFHRDEIEAFIASKMVESSKLSND